MCIFVYIRTHSYRDSMLTLSMGIPSNPNRRDISFLIINELNTKIRKLLCDTLI